MRVHTYTNRWLMTQTRSPLARITVTAALVRLLLLAQLAQAGTPADADVPKYTLRYDPQTLQSPVGRKALTRRIAQAARIVCGDRETIALLGEVAQYNSCVRQATDRALADVAAQRAVVEAQAK